MRAILSAITMTLIFSGCGSSSHEYSKALPVEGNLPGKAGGTLPDDPPGVIGFATVSKVFQANQCLNCHAPPRKKGGVDLTNYASAVKAAKDIQDDIATGEMPPRGPAVNAADQATIDAWILAGMPK